MEDRMKKLLSKPLLMVIDMQNIYSNGQKWECKNFGRAVDKIKSLLNSCNSEDVLFTRYIASETPNGIWADYNVENADVNADVWSNEITKDLVGYSDRYKVIDKEVYSSLGNAEVKATTELASCVVVTGVVAECCVLSTVMSLIDEGIYVIYLKDAVAGADDDTENAVVKVLEGLVPLHLSILDTKEYMKLIKEVE